MTSEKWPWTLNSQKYPVYITCQPLKSILFLSVSLYDQLFSRHKVDFENWKFTKWPETDFIYLTMKNTVYIYQVPTTEPQIFVCFALRPSIVKIQGCWKWEISHMYQMTPDWYRILTVKSTSYTAISIITPEVQIWVRFGLQPFSRFQDTRLSRLLKFEKKIEMYQMTSKWPWTLNSQKYLAYTKYLLPRPTF